MGGEGTCRLSIHYQPNDPLQPMKNLLGNNGIEAAAVVEPSVDSHNRLRPGAPHLASNLSHGQLERDLLAFRRGGERAI